MTEPILFLRDHENYLKDHGVIFASYIPACGWAPEGWDFAKPCAALTAPAGTTAMRWFKEDSSARVQEATAKLGREPDVFMVARGQIFIDDEHDTGPQYILFQ